MQTFMTNSNAVLMKKVASMLYAVWCKKPPKIIPKHIYTRWNAGKAEIEHLHLQHKNIQSIAATELMTSAVGSLAIESCGHEHWLLQRLYLSAGNENQPQQWFEMEFPTALNSCHQNTITYLKVTNKEALSNKTAISSHKSQASNVNKKWPTHYSSLFYVHSMMNR